MRSVSVRLVDLDKVKINLGFAGENEHTHVLFDCKKAFDQYPNATPFLIVTPPRGDIYPAVVTRDGDIVEWVVTDSDLIYHGNGKVQLQFKQGDIIMKSYEARTSIAESSEPTGTTPTPVQHWITQANAILASIPDDINAALAEAKASGEFDGADGVGIAAITHKSTVGLVDTYTITLTDGNSYDFTVTNGRNGDDGDDGVGIQSIAKTGTVGLVDTYTITLTNGQTYTFTVTNGQNGQSGAQIDDTTPAVDKVFSSSKVDEMNTQLLNAIHQMQTGGKLLSNPVKAALINLFDHVAYTDGNAQVYIQALKEAWKVTGTLVSISADFEQGSAVINIDDSLSTLRQYLTVTGTFTYGGNEFTEEILDYTLSGTLTSGESTITATYEGKTAEFTVMVESELPSAYQKVEYIGATAQDQYILFSDIQVADTDALKKYAFEIDFEYDSWNGVANTNIVAGFSSFGGLWIGYNNQVGNIAMGTTSGCFFTDNRPTDRHKYSFVYDQSVGLYGACSFVRDDSTSITRSLADDDFNSHIFCLFSGVDSNSGSGRNSNFDFKGKIYSFSMTYEGDPLLNLVPCYRKADNVIGFYDTVGETFYTNSGSGTFTKGGNV